MIHSGTSKWCQTKKYFAGQYSKWVSEPIHERLSPLQFSTALCRCCLENIIWCRGSDVFLICISSSSLSWINRKKHNCEICMSNLHEHERCSPFFDQKVREKCYMHVVAYNPEVRAHYFHVCLFSKTTDRWEWMGANLRCSKRCENQTWNWFLEILIFVAQKGLFVLKLVSSFSN